MMVPVKRRKERSLGEMISSVSFYGLGIYAILEAMLLYEEGDSLLKCVAIGLAGLSCVAAGARFIIANLVMRMRGETDG
jgi:ABC-type branched-subunit amino acid transport system permease subunit